MGWEFRARSLVSALCPLPSSPWTPTLPQCLQPQLQQPGLHHPRLCLQSSRWRSEAWCPPPSFPLTPSIPPGHSSSFLPAQARSTLDTVCLTLRLAAPSPPSPAPRESRELQLQRQREGGWGLGSAQAGTRRSPSLFPRSVEGRCFPPKEHLVVGRVWPPGFRDKVRNDHLLNKS